MNPVRVFHYSYISPKNVYEKMLYYTLTFKRNYMDDWYAPVWQAWTPENRSEIESKYSIHPTVKGATTTDVVLEHPVHFYDL